ncbi:MAG TPA: DUF554 domain-containing protein [Anaerolineae bacterium]|nr:DUF554 domain-containing protein [Anaerolineae bacterium]
MTGTLINIATILVGGGMGMLFGSRLPERVRQTVVSGLGLFTLAMGIRMFLDTQNALIVVVSLLIGALLGEWWRIEDGLSAIGKRLEARFVSGEGQKDLFVRGFLTSSLLFCVGPMTILGSIQDGLLGDFHLLAIKSVLDGFAALAFASTLGVGVLFSVLVVLVYQGGISLMAAQAEALLSEAMVAEMTAVGGVLLVGLAIGSLLELRPIRTGNLLPALVIAPLIVAVLAGLGLN